MKEEKNEYMENKEKDGNWKMKESKFQTLKVDWGIKEEGKEVQRKKERIGAENWQAKKAER